MSCLARVLASIFFAYFSISVLAPSDAQAFSGGFWRNRLRAPLWPARKHDPAIPPATCSGVGDNAFRACYFNGVNFETLKVVKDVSKVDFDWGTGSPDPSIQADGFSARFTGTFDVSGQTTFTVTGDDGVRLWIDDRQVIDQWSIHSPTTYTFSMALTSGKHKIELEYFESQGGAVVELSWAASGGGTGGTPGCVNGVLSDPKAFFFSIIGKNEGSSAADWATVMDQSGIPTAPGPGVRPDLRDHFGLTQQRGSGGNVRGRIFLPTNTPDSNNYYLRAIDVLSGNPIVWKWNDWISGQPEYAPQPCR